MGTDQIQRSPLFCAPGLVKFVPSVARLFCLALPGSFLTMFAQNKEELCCSSKAPSDQQEKCGFDSVIDFHDNLPCRGGKGTVLGRPHERPVAVAGPVNAAHQAKRTWAQFNLLPLF